MAELLLLRCAAILKGGQFLDEQVALSLVQVTSTLMSIFRPTTLAKYTYP